MESDNNLRRQVERSLEEGDFGLAAQALAGYWRQEKSAAVAHFVNSTFERIAPRVPLTPLKLALLRSFTVEPLVPLLRAAAFSAGIRLQVWVSDFNTYAQDVLNPQSALYEFQPNVAILATHTVDFAPGLWRSFSLGAEESVAAVEDLSGRFRGLVEAFRKYSTAHLVLHNLVHPTVPSAGLLDAQSTNSQHRVIEQINHELRKIASQQTGVYILDYDALVARHGRERWTDQRKWLTMRLPVGASQMMHLVDEWLRFLHPLSGKIAKAVAVDLDNTLWGGIIAEEGMSGIQLGPEYPGAAFQDMQRALLDLYHRGILLAIVSKNNPADAMEVISQHPHMVLRTEHFAALRINWQNKVQNLREIASELNIGIDTIVFADDNPVERQHVRLELPEVTVLELPKDALGYARALRDCPALERLHLSEEDRQRGIYYARQRQRAELEQTSGSPEAFLRSLRQSVDIRPVAPMTRARVAQLTQKTNQFNLTTRRYSEQQIQEMAAHEDIEIFAMRLEDVYIDNGLVGVAILRHEDRTCEIDTFLLSCRVIGRTVETALLSFLSKHARDRGAGRLEGWYLPTKKNAPAEDFYARHGFQLVEETAIGKRFALDLSARNIVVPDWITLT